MRPVTLTITGVGVIGHQLSGWPHCRALLRGEAPAEVPAAPVTSMLSPRERRRAPATVRLAMAAAEAACNMAGVDPASLPAVFSSGMGDVEITDYMCAVLADDPALLSPTRFHNSVHNAPSGYWSIGAGVTGDVTAISAFRDSAGAGLLEATLRAADTGGPVLVACYDVAGHGPLRDIWPAQHAFAAALVLTAGESAAGTRLEAGITDRPETLPPLPPALAALARDNPAAGMLHVLAVLAGCAPYAVVPAGGDCRLVVKALDA